MQKMTELDRRKLCAVKEYLERYATAVENQKNLAELNHHIADDINNPSVGGRGFSASDGGKLSGGAGSTVFRADVLESYSQSQARRNTEIMKEVEGAIALLGVIRGKTIIEKRFLMSLPWRKIQKDMNMCTDTCRKHYKQTMLQLYDLMVEHEMIEAIEKS